MEHAPEEGKAELIELAHSIGYTGKHQRTLMYHPTKADTLIYNNGGLVVIENLHEKHQQEFLRGHDMEVTASTVSNSGRLLATGQLGSIFQKTPEAPVILWDFDARQPLAVLKGITVGVKRLEFSPDEKFLACIGDNNTFIIWDTNDGSAIHTHVFEHPILIMSWGDIQVDANPKHPSYIIVTASSSAVHINTLEYDIASMQYYLNEGSCQMPNTGLTRNYTFSTINGDMLMAGTSGGEICLFSIYSQIYRATMPLSSNGLLSITLMDDKIFIGGGDGKVKKLSTEGGRWNLTHEAQLDGKVTSLSLSNDKKELIAGTSKSKIYRMLTSDLSFMIHTDAHYGGINDVAFGGNDNEFTCIDETGILKIWDNSEYKTVFTASGGKNSEGCSCCLAEDGTIVTGWSDGFIRCFDPQTHSIVWEVANAHRGRVTSVYADGNYILSGGEEGAVRVWGRTNRKLLIQFHDHKKDVVSLFPDYKEAHIIHSCSLDRSLCTYDLKAETKINGHQTKNGSLFGMTQRKDNEYELITSGQGAPIYFWDCDEINPVAEIVYPYKVLTLDISPSGRFLAFGTETNELFIYSINGTDNHEIVTKGVGHSGPITKLKWTPDEKQIVTVSTDASICIWNFYGGS